MNHLQIIKDAYDKCDILYIVKQNAKGWSYLFLTNGKDMKQLEATNLDFLCQYKNFIEFNDNGSVVSY